MRGPSGSVSQSAALSARIEEKRAELRHLKELRDLSGAVAAQMEALETKLSTLSDGTEGQTSAATFRTQLTGTSHCDRHGQLA